MKRVVVAFVSLLSIMTLNSTDVSAGGSRKPASASTVAKPSSTEDIKKVQAKIKTLDADKEAIEDSMEVVGDLIKGAIKGKMLIIPWGETMMVGSSKDFADILAAQVLAETLSKAEAAILTRNVQRTSQATTKSLNANLQRLKTRLERTQANLTRALTEQAQLVEAEPNQSDAEPKSDKGEKAGTAETEKAVKEGNPADAGNEKTAKPAAKKPAAATKKPVHTKPPSP